MTNTTKHPYAEILHGIAEGKEIQVLSEARWREIFSSAVLRNMSRSDFACNSYRIKPDTITVNGVECEAPSRVITQFKIRVILFDDLKAIKETRFFFDNKEDGYIAYAALVKPFLSLSEYK